MIWVDDLLIAGNNGWDIAAVKVQSAGEFDMKDLGELKHFLGMRITRNSDGGISIDQSGYIRQVLERYGMSNSKPASTPLAPGAHLAKATEAGHENVDLKLYPGILWGQSCMACCSHAPIWHSQNRNFHNSVQTRRTHIFKLENEPCSTSKEPKNSWPRLQRRNHGCNQAYCDADYVMNRDRKPISGYLSSRSCRIPLISSKWDFLCSLSSALSSSSSILSLNFFIVSLGSAMRLKFGFMVVKPVHTKTQPDPGPTK